MIRTLRNLLRLAFIAAVLLRYDVLCVRKSGARQGIRLAKAFERLGPTFIKLGQAISTRSDLIGDEMADDLASLRDKLSPFSTRIARQIIEAELGKPIEALFQHFDDVAVAAASIAQVHKATLFDGSQVAVKIVRPNIEKAFAKDVELFFWIADIIEQRLPSYRRLKAREVVQTFKETIFFELDLRFEAAACDEMAANIKRHEAGLRVPKIYWEQTARRVLVMEWVDGIPFSDMEAIRASGFDLNLLLEKASKSLFSQVFEDGFFHADLHPGNLFLDTQTGELVAIDFGIMGRLNWESRAYIARIIHGFLNEDYRSVAELHFAAGYVPAGKNLDNFVQACKAVARPIVGKPLNEISVAALLGQMFKIAAEFEMETQPQLLLMQKTLMVAEGVGRMLNPNVNMWELAEPLIEEWAHKHFSKQAQLKMAADHAKKIAFKLPSILQNFEKTLAHFADAGGLKLHPDSIRAIHQTRTRAHRHWLFLGWMALIVVVTIAYYY